jgi:uncharacterized protein involved in exopolysaccharide biosynthesis
MSGPGLWPVVRRWWWLLVAGAAVAGAIAWILASSATKTYESTAKLLVGPVSGDYPTLQASGALGRTYAELAQSRRTVEAAAREAGLRLTRREVDESVRATSNDVTRIVTLRVRLDDRRAAAALGHALSNQLLRLRRGVPADPAGAVIDDPRLADLNARERRSLRDAVEKVVGVTNPGTLEVVEPADVPRDPVAPRVPLIVLLAALAGALVASAYAIVREAGAGGPATPAAGAPPAVPDDPMPFFEIEDFDDAPAHEPGVLVRRWADEERLR